MADPVLSVAFAIELRCGRCMGISRCCCRPWDRDWDHCPGHAELLAACALLFRRAAGSPEAAGRAFGEEWSFLPIGALVDDLALTIAISIAAAGSAIIAYVPGLAPDRIPIALALTALVAGLTRFGHGGRMIFAIMTWLFIIASAAMLAFGWDLSLRHPWQRADHRLRKSGALRRRVRLSGRDGARDRHRGTRYLDSRSRSP